MKIEERIIYKCDHCNKIYQIKHFCESHERGCNKNPKNISACAACDHMKEGETTVSQEDGDHPWSMKQKTFFCQKLQKKLYPAKVVRKGLLEKYPETFEGMEQMPNTCTHWEIKLPF